MKTLIVYYSRTGVTKTVTDLLANLLSADTEELIDTKKRSGVIGFASGCKDAIAKKSFQTEPIKADLQNYDLVIVATPVWANTMSTATRYFLEQFGDKISQAAVFCTTGRTGIEKTNFQLAEYIAGNVIASAGFVQKNVKKGKSVPSIEAFAELIKENFKPIILN